jgi:hypothetical protein
MGIAGLLVRTPRGAGDVANLAPWKHQRIVNQLTVARLALQVAERWSDLSDQQRALLRTALAATTALAVELLAPAAEATGDRLNRPDATDGPIAEAVRRYAAVDGERPGPAEAKPGHERGNGQAGAAEAARPARSV